MVAYMKSNKKICPIVTELLFKRKKTQYFTCFISQSYFKVHKTIRLTAANCFIIKIPRKREIQQIASNHSSDIDFKEFMKLYKDYNEEPYSFLVKNTTLSSDNQLRFRKNLL